MIHQEETVSVFVFLIRGETGCRILYWGLRPKVISIEDTLGAIVAVGGKAGLHAVAVGEEEEAGVGVYELLEGGPGGIDGGVGGGVVDVGD